jgi:hypothetical protein
MLRSRDLTQILAVADSFHRENVSVKERVLDDIEHNGIAKFPESDKDG